MRKRQQVLIAFSLAAAASAGAQGGVSSTMAEAWHFEGAQSVFHAPRSLVVTGQCHVWIADAESGVWRLPCDGSAPQAIATKGRAVGEYQQAWELAPVGQDSVAVFDRDLRRITVYSSSGAVGPARDIRLPEASVGQVSGMSCARGLVISTSQYPNVTEPGALHSMVVSLKPDGIARDTLATFPGIPSIYWGSSFGGSRLAIPNQRRTYVSFARDGGFIAGANDSASVVVYGADGHPVRTLKLSALPPQKLNGSDRDAYADSVRRVTEHEMLVLHYNSPEKAQYKLQIETYLREDVGFPESRQLFDALVLDQSGDALWVLLSGTGKSYSRTWNVYSTASGELLRRVAVSHKGAIVAAAVRDGALYAIEQPLGGAVRVASYTEAPR